MTFWGLGLNTHPEFCRGITVNIFINKKSQKSTLVYMKVRGPDLSLSFYSCVCLYSDLSWKWLSSRSCICFHFCFHHPEKNQMWNRLVTSVCPVVTSPMNISVAFGCGGDYSVLQWSESALNSHLSQQVYDQFKGSVSVFIAVWHFPFVFYGYETFEAKPNFIM